jgi:acyl-coenzyme A thioesterase PaaI-like protein
MKAFALLPGLLQKARTSPFYLWLLNRLLGYVVPFNRPHGFAIARIDEDRIVTRAPYRRVNHNHLRGIHACAIATIAESSSGLALLTRLDPAEYRLIMARLEIDYLFQARQEIQATTVLDLQQVVQQVIKPLQLADAVSFTQETLVTDRQGHEVAKAFITWQIKPWAKVKTRLD